LNPSSILLTASLGHRGHRGLRAIQPGGVTLPCIQTRPHRRERTYLGLLSYLGVSYIQMILLALLRLLQLVTKFVKGKVFWVFLSSFQVEFDSAKQTGR